MYVGPLDDPLLANRLLEEGLCLSIVSARKKEATKVSVRLGPDEGEATITDDGLGLPLKVHKLRGREDALAESIFTQLYGCRDLKDNNDDKAHCSMGIVVLNALCSSLDVWTWVEGNEWTMRFERGNLVSRFTKGAPTTRHGMEISFKLDAAIIQKRAFQIDDLRAWGQGVFGEATFEVT